MATDKKQSVERKIEDQLKSLFKLQSYLSEIDGIKILRGELPNEVKDREDETIRFQTRIAKHEEEIKSIREYILQKQAAIQGHRENIARYEDQISNVRNNREFAFLEKEKEYENLEIELAEKNIRDARAKEENQIAEIEHDRRELSDNEQILEQKRVELDQIISETRQKEEDILIKAKNLEDDIDPKYLTAFKRIRKNARNGLGIVTVQRNACGGCFNRIPPQRQLEIRMHKKVIVCEYCGRIIVDGALVGCEEAAKPAAPAPKRGRRSVSGPATL